MLSSCQVLQESLQVPGTGVYLVYHSSETPGYMSTIMIQLTPDHVPSNLGLVHLRVSVEGLVYETVFEADADLKYKFAWERRNAYNQKVYGIVTAHGKLCICNNSSSNIYEFSFFNLSCMYFFYVWCF